MKDEKQKKLKDHLEKSHLIEKQDYATDMEKYFYRNHFLDKSKQLQLLNKAQNEKSVQFEHNTAV